MGRQFCTSSCSSNKRDVVFRVIFLLCVFFFAHSQAAVSMLKQDFKEGEMTLSSALALAVKVLNKTMDVSKLSAEKGADLSS